ncbi:zinc ribbon domain-containing protein [Pseudonocardia sp. RS11V-5]|uniref:zinc ribbon domain-containing protein n=1 Tax=Pseudonocardia terrae TaxID=2905831 RepID=UPI001E579137|nr:zinc ribbon domain-containing protein [Pseudonocardia terrae]MCE3549901.1 zinc ribbon domain-containing protein [Pseudonocardia terrae]
MTTYSFRCEEHGTIDVRRDFGAAPPVAPCPLCGLPMRRVWTAPMVSLAPRAAVEAIDRAERSRTEPEVVTRVPGRPGRRTTAPTPAQQRLPRP